MRTIKFFLQLALVLTAGLVFSSCLNNPDKGDPDVKLFQANEELGVPAVPVAIQQPSEGVTKFQEPLAKGVVNTQADVLAIREVLAKIFDFKLADVQITIESESSLDYATGYTNIGEGDEGGIYFAAKQDDSWVIAYNGVGTLTCKMIEDYDFPAGLIPKCYDLDSGVMVER